MRTVAAQHSAVMGTAMARTAGTFGSGNAFMCERGMMNRSLRA